MLRERLRSGHSVLAAAFGPDGPLAAGSCQAVDDVAEITGVGVLPSARRQGLGAAVTALLARDALDRLPVRQRRRGGPGLRQRRLPRDRHRHDRRARPRLISAARNDPGWLPVLAGLGPGWPRSWLASVLAGLGPGWPRSWLASVLAARPGQRDELAGRRFQIKVSGHFVGPPVCGTDGAAFARHKYLTNPPPRTHRSARAGSAQPGGSTRRSGDPILNGVVMGLPALLSPSQRLARWPPRL
jgi:hypothetical protein